MKQKKSAEKLIRKITEGRAARIFAVAASVFLCVLTAVEFTALKMEWEIPVLEAIGGENTFWMLNYRAKETALEISTENILLEEKATADASGRMDETEKKDTPEQEELSGEAEVSPKIAGVETTGKGEAAEQPKGMEETGDETDSDKSKETEDKADPDEPENTEELEESEKLPYYIRVNRKQNCVTVYTMDENGEYTVPYKAMICSTGLYNATPRGTFHLSTKYLWRELYGGVYGQYATRIHGGILFHSVPYYRKSKSTLCTDKYNKLGQQASMGCIRLTVEDAKWIAENCPTGTSVEIYDDEEPGPLGKPEAQKIDKSSPNKNWDPTDPDEENPWKILEQ